MKLTFIGSESAFTVGQGNFHSNMLLETPSGQRLLIDCGSDARWALYQLGLTHRDIHAVYISHLHADHVGGLEWLGFSTFFDSAAQMPQLITSEHLVNTLWENVLKGGMSSLEDRVADLNSFFNVKTVPYPGSFDWEGVHFKLVKTCHVIANHRVQPSFGLMINADQHHILLTTDTQFIPDEFNPLYKEADLIFHDCETSYPPSGVHTHFEDLLTLPLAIRQKMWLYHYNPGKLPDALQKGFKGFVEPSQVFNLEDPATYKPIDNR